MTRPSDRRLLRYARPARPYLIGLVVVSVVVAGLVIAQAQLLATAIAGTFRGGLNLPALTAAIVALAAVVAARAALAWALEALSYRASAGVKSQLRRDLLRRSVELGPRWLATRRASDLATLTTTGVDALDAYFARYLPQVVLAVVIPLAVVARLLAADPLSAAIIIVTLPLVPLFMALVGATTAERTGRRWRELARLSHHFLDVVAGLPTLRVFGRAKAQAKSVDEVTGAYRRATLATLRLAFLSALVLELLATYSVALVAVAIGLRLRGGHLDLQTGLLVLVLAPEAYLPLRQLASHYHASADGLAAVGDAFDILDTPSDTPSDEQLPGAPETAPARFAVPARAVPARVTFDVVDAPSDARPGEQLPGAPETAPQLPGAPETAPQLPGAPETAPARSALPAWAVSAQAVRAESAGVTFDVVDTPSDVRPATQVPGVPETEPASFAVPVQTVPVQTVPVQTVSAQAVPAQAMPAVPLRAESARVTAVRVEDVRVRHPGRNQPAPDGAALRFAAGEVVALAGSSGSGKSTLIGVLLGFITPDAGRVVIEEVGRERNLGQLDPRAWRARVAWVPQDPVLQHGTVESNIRLGQPDAPRAAVERAAQRAALHEVELARAVGEGGSGLSAGQRRRVAVARALLTERPVLLLDEPTAGLDADTEAQVLASVRELARDGRLVLMVAHRPMVLAAADRVVTLPTPEEIPAATADLLGARTGAAV